MSDLNKYQDGGATTPPKENKPSNDNSPLASTGSSYVDAFNGLGGIDINAVMDAGGGYSASISNKGISMSLRLPSGAGINDVTVDRNKGKKYYKPTKDVSGEGYSGIQYSEIDEEGNPTGKTRNKYKVAPGYSNDDPTKGPLVNKLEGGGLKNYKSGRGYNQSLKSLSQHYTNRFDDRGDNPYTLEYLNDKGFLATRYTDFGDIAKLESERQGTLSKTWNSMLNPLNLPAAVLGSMATGIVGTIGAIGTLMWDDGDYSNWATKLSDSMRTGRKKAADAMGWGSFMMGGGTIHSGEDYDSGWWLGGFSDTMTSMAEFVLTSYITGGVGALAKKGAMMGVNRALQTSKGMRAAKAGAKSIEAIQKAGGAGKAVAGAEGALATAQKIEKGLDYANRIGSTTFMGYQEGSSAARDTYKAIYEYQIKMGKSDAEAKEAAKSGAKATAQFVTAGSALLNITSMAPIFRKNASILGDIKTKGLFNKVDLEKNLQESAKKLAKNRPMGRGQRKVTMADVGDDFSVASGQKKRVSKTNKKTGVEEEVEVRNWRAVADKMTTGVAEAVQEGAEEVLAHVGGKYGEQKGKDYFEKDAKLIAEARRLGVSVDALKTAGYTANMGGYFDAFKKYGMDKEAMHSFMWGAVGGTIMPYAMNRIPGGAAGRDVYDTYTEKDKKDGTIPENYDVGDIKLDATGQPKKYNALEAIKKGDWSSLNNVLTYSNGRSAKDAERRVYNNARREMARQMNEMQEMQNELRKIAADPTLSTEEKEFKMNEQKSRILSAESYVAAAGGWSGAYTARLGALRDVDNSTDIRDSMREELNAIDEEMPDLVAQVEAAKKEDEENTEQEGPSAKTKQLEAQLTNLQNERARVEQLANSAEPVTEAMLYGYAENMQDDAYKESAIAAIEEVEEMQKYYEHLDDLYGSPDLETQEYKRLIANTHARKYFNRKAAERLGKEEEFRKEELRKELEETFGEDHVSNQLVQDMLEADMEYKALLEEQERVNKEFGKLASMINSPRLRDYAIRELSKSYPDIAAEVDNKWLAFQEASKKLAEKKAAKEDTTEAQKNLDELSEQITNHLKDAAARRKNTTLEALETRIADANMKRLTAAQNFKAHAIAFDHTLSGEEGQEAANRQLLEALSKDPKTLKLDKDSKDVDDLMDQLRAKIKGDAAYRASVDARNKVRYQSEADFFDAAEQWLRSAGPRNYYKKMYRERGERYASDLKKIQEELNNDGAKERNKMIAELAELEKFTDSLYESLNPGIHSEENTDVEITPDGDVIITNASGEIVSVALANYLSAAEQDILDKYLIAKAQYDKIAELKNEVEQELAETTKRLGETKLEVEKVKKAELEEQQKIQQDATNEQSTGVSLASPKDSISKAIEKSKEIKEGETPNLDSGKSTEFAKKRVKARKLGLEKIFNLAEQRKKLKRLRSKQLDVANSEAELEQQLNEGIKEVEERLAKAETNGKSLDEVNAQIAEEYKKATGRTLFTPQQEGKQAAVISLDGQLAALEDEVNILAQEAALLDAELQEAGAAAESFKTAADSYLSPMRSRVIMGDNASEALYKLEQQIMKMLPTHLRQLYERGQLNLNKSPEELDMYLLDLQIKNELRLGNIKESDIPTIREGYKMLREGRGLELFQKSKAQRDAEAKLEELKKLMTEEEQKLSPEDQILRLAELEEQLDEENKETDKENLADELANAQEHLDKLKEEEFQRSKVLRGIVMSAKRGFSVASMINQMSVVNPGVVKMTITGYKVEIPENMEEPLTPMTKLLLDIQNTKEALKDDESDDESKVSAIVSTALENYMKSFDLIKQKELNKYSENIDALQQSFVNAYLTLDKEYNQSKLFQHWESLLQDKRTELEEKEKNVIAQITDLEKQITESGNTAKLHILNEKLQELKSERSAILEAKNNAVRSINSLAKKELVTNIMPFLDSYEKALVEDLSDLMEELEEMKDFALELRKDMGKIRAALAEAKAKNKVLRGKIQTSRKGQLRREKEKPKEKRRKAEDIPYTKKTRGIIKEVEELREQIEAMENELNESMDFHKSLLADMTKTNAKVLEAKENLDSIKGDLKAVRDDLKSTGDQLKDFESEHDGLGDNKFADLSKDGKVLTADEIKARQQKRKEEQDRVNKAKQLDFTANAETNEYDEQVVLDRATNESDLTVDPTQVDSQDASSSYERVEALVEKILAKTEQVSAEGEADEDLTKLEELLEGLKDDYFFKFLATVIKDSENIPAETKSNYADLVLQVETLRDRIKELQDNEEDNIKEAVEAAEKEYVEASKLLWNLINNKKKATEEKDNSKQALQTAIDRIAFVQSRLKSSTQSIKSLRNQMETAAQDILDTEQYSLGTDLALLEAAVRQQMEEAIRKVVATGWLEQGQRTEVTHRYNKATGELQVQTTGVTGIYLVDENGEIDYEKSTKIHAASKLDVEGNLLNTKSGLSRFKTSVVVPQGYSFIIVTDPLLSEKGKEAARKDGVLEDDRNYNIKEALAALVEKAMHAGVDSDPMEDHKFNDTTIITFHRNGNRTEGFKTISRDQRILLARLRHEEGHIQRVKEAEEAARKQAEEEAALEEEEKRNKERRENLTKLGKQSDAEKEHETFFKRIKKAFKDSFVSSMGDLPKNKVDGGNTFNYTPPSANSTITIDDIEFEVVRIGDPKDTELEAQGFHTNTLKLRAKNKATGSYFEFDVIEAVDKSSGEITYVLASPSNDTLNGAKKQFKEDIDLLYTVNDGSDEDDKGDDDKKKDDDEEDKTPPTPPTVPPVPPTTPKPPAGTKGIDSSIKTFLRQYLTPGGKFTANGINTELTLTMDSDPLFGDYNASSGYSIVNAKVEVVVGKDDDGFDKIEKVKVKIQVDKDMNMTFTNTSVADVKKLLAKRDAELNSNPINDGDESVPALKAFFESLQKKAKSNESKGNGAYVTMSDIVDILLMQNMRGAPLSRFLPLLMSAKNGNSIKGLKIKVGTAKEATIEGQSKPSPAVYDTQTKEIVINGEMDLQASEFERVFMHELMHAITFDTVLGMDGAGKDRFRGFLMDLAKAMGVRLDGTENLDPVEIMDEGIHFSTEFVSDLLNAVDERTDLTSDEKEHIKSRFIYIFEAGGFDSDEEYQSFSINGVAEMVAIFLTEPQFIKLLKGTKMTPVGDQSVVESSFWDTLKNLIYDVLSSIKGNTAQDTFDFLVKTHFEKFDELVEAPAPIVPDPEDSPTGGNIAERAKEVLIDINSNKQTYYQYEDAEGNEHKMLVISSGGDFLNVKNLETGETLKIAAKTFAENVAKGQEADYNELNKQVLADLFIRIANAETHADVAAIRTQTYDTNDLSFAVLSKKQRQDIDKKLNEKDKTLKKIKDQKAFNVYVTKIESIDKNLNPEQVVQTLFAIAKDITQSANNSIKDEDLRIQLINMVINKISDTASSVEVKSNYVAKVQMIKNLLGYPGNDDVFNRALDSVIDKLLQDRIKDLDAYIDSILNTDSDAYKALAKTSGEVAMKYMVNQHGIKSMEDLQSNPELLSLYTSKVQQLIALRTEKLVHNMYVKAKELENELKAFVGAELNKLAADSSLDPDKVIQKRSLRIKNAAARFANSLKAHTYDKLQNFTNTEYIQLNHRIPPADQLQGPFDYSSNSIYKYVGEADGMVTLSTLDGKYFEVPSKHVFDLRKGDIHNNPREIIYPDTINQLYTVNSRGKSVYLSEAEIETGLLDFYNAVKTARKIKDKDKKKLYIQRAEQHLKDFFGDIGVSDIKSAGFFEKLAEAVERIKQGGPKQGLKFIEEYKTELSKLTFDNPINSKRNLISSIIYSKVQEKLRNGLPPGAIVEDMRIVIHTLSDKRNKAKEKEANKMTGDSSNSKEAQLKNNKIFLNDAKRAQNETRDVIGIARTSGVTMTVKVKIQGNDGKTKWIDVGFPNNPNYLVKVEKGIDGKIYPYHPGIILEKFHEAETEQEQNDILEEFFHLYDVPGYYKDAMRLTEDDPSFMSPIDVLEDIGYAYQEAAEIFEVLGELQQKLEVETGRTTLAFDGKDIEKIVKIQPSSGSINFDNQPSFNLLDVKSNSNFHPFYDAQRGVGDSMVIVDTGIALERSYETEIKDSKLLYDADKMPENAEEEIKKALASSKNVNNSLKRGKSRYYMVLKSPSGDLMLVPIKTRNTNELDTTTAYDRVKDAVVKAKNNSSALTLIHRTDGKLVFHPDNYDKVKLAIHEAFHNIVEDSEGQKVNKGVFFKLFRHDPKGKVNVEVMPTFKDGSATTPATILKGRDKNNTIKGKDLDTNRVTVKISRYNPLLEKNEAVYVDLDISSKQSFMESLEINAATIGRLGLSIPFDGEFDEALEKFQLPVKVPPFRNIKIGISFDLDPTSNHILDTIEKIKSDKKKRQEEEDERLRSEEEEKLRNAKEEVERRRNKRRVEEEKEINKQEKLRKQQEATKEARRKREDKLADLDVYYREVRKDFNEAIEKIKDSTRRIYKFGYNAPQKEIQERSAKDLKNFAVFIYNMEAYRDALIDIQMSIERDSREGDSGRERFKATIENEIASITSILDRATANIKESIKNYNKKTTGLWGLYRSADKTRNNLGYLNREVKNTLDQMYSGPHEAGKHLTIVTSLLREVLQTQTDRLEALEAEKIEKERRERLKKEKEEAEKLAKEKAAEKERKLKEQQKKLLEKEQAAKKAEKEALKAEQEAELLRQQQEQERLKAEADKVKAELESEKKAEEKRLAKEAEERRKQEQSDAERELLERELAHIPQELINTLYTSNPSSSFENLLNELDFEQGLTPNQMLQLLQGKLDVVEKHILSYLMSKMDWKEDVGRFINMVQPLFKKYAMEYGDSKQEILEQKIRDTAAGLYDAYLSIKKRLKEEYIKKNGNPVGLGFVEKEGNNGDFILFEVAEAADLDMHENTPKLWITPTKYTYRNGELKKEPYRDELYTQEKLGKLRPVNEVLENNKIKVDNVEETPSDNVYQEVNLTTETAREFNEALEESAEIVKDYILELAEHNEDLGAAFEFLIARVENKKGEQYISNMFSAYADVVQKAFGTKLDNKTKDNVFNKFMDIVELNSDFSDNYQGMFLLMAETLAYVRNNPNQFDALTVSTATDLFTFRTPDGAFKHGFDPVNDEDALDFINTMENIANGQAYSDDAEGGYMAKRVAKELAHLNNESGSSLATNYFMVPYNLVLFDNSSIRPTSVFEPGEMDYDDLGELLGNAGALRFNPEWLLHPSMKNYTASENNEQLKAIVDSQGTVYVDKPELRDAFFIVQQKAEEEQDKDDLVIKLHKAEQKILENKINGCK